MKRKQMIWIVVTIVLLIIVITAIFATVIPRPYAFLANGTFRPELSRIRVVSLNGTVSMARTSFIVNQPLQDLSKTIQDQLPHEAGWDWTASKLEWERHFINDSKLEWVSLYDATFVSAELKGQTLVRIEHVASLRDKIFLRFKGKERKSGD